MRNNLVNFRLKDDREINRIAGSVLLKVSPRPYVKSPR